MAKVTRTVGSGAGFDLSPSRKIAPSAKDEQIKEMMDNTFYSLSSTVTAQNSEPVEAAGFTNNITRTIEEKEADGTAMVSNNEEVKEKRKRGRKPSKIGKETLNATIDKDIYEYLEELSIETREPKSMIVNKILLLYMKENRIQQ